MSRLFDKQVRLEGTRGANVPRVASTFSACIMDGSFDSPFDGDSVQSTIRKCTIVVKRRALAPLVPQTGDVVSLPDGRRFAVKAVQPFYDSEYILDARQC